MSLRRFTFLCLPAFMLAGVLFFSGVARAYAQDKPPDQLRTLSRDELDVIKVLTMQERAWNQGNIEAYTSGYKNSPETLFLANSINRGYQQILDDYKHNYPNKEAMGTLTFLDLEPHVLDDRFAIVLGKYHVERSKKMGGPADGIFSLVMEKTDQGWKIVVAHTT
jgi:ketosteroid isomerase-like protein